MTFPPTCALLVMHDLMGTCRCRPKALMRNVPTDLLRAFVTIVDLRGYTRAGERLGRSQPAMSL
jgi:hypothetical protein